MADKVDFYQVYYEDWQRDHLFMWAKPYFNASLTPFFENHIIADVVSASTADKIAVCSWALNKKMTFRIPPRRELSEDVLQEDFDVMSFTKNSASHDMLGALESWHPGANDILQKICAKLGVGLQNPKFPIYQNAFCSRSEVYKRYVSEFLSPAMDLMATDSEIRSLCFQDSKYVRTTLNIPVDFNRIKRNLGFPWYPLHPFILERCFSIWIDDKDLKVVYL